MIPVAAGDALPAGTDAVVPFELAELDGQSFIEIVEAVAAGDNVEQQGAVATIGAILVSAGMRLAERHIGLLTNAGVSDIAVVRRPRVRLLVNKPTSDGAREDSNGSMICAAVERDGGIIGESIAVKRNQMAIRAALLEPGADVALVIGGTGPGNDDHSASALSEAGELARHCIGRVCVDGGAAAHAADFLLRCQTAIVGSGGSPYLFILKIVAPTSDTKFLKTKPQASVASPNAAITHPIARTHRRRTIMLLDDSPRQPRPMPASGSRVSGLIGSPR
jgi:hypothetical protein